MPKILSDPKARMLQEVQRLLTQEGYCAVTIRAVAVGCGLAVGTVYNYFPSKEALLAEYLLIDWRQCIASIQSVSETAATAEPVARCICDELGRFSRSHAAIFREEAARGAFVGSFGQYHALLRSQLAAPLEPFFGGSFPAQFAAESLLTWTMAGKEFREIWDLLGPIANTEKPKE